MKKRIVNILLMDKNDLATILVDIFYQVHITLGPGLPESVYEEAISNELTQKSLEFKANMEYL